MGLIPPHFKEDLGFKNSTGCEDRNTAGGETKEKKENGKKP